MQDVGFFMAIIIGGLAGWLAQKAMRGSGGLLMNIILGVAGAFVANSILIGVSFQATFLGNLIAGFVGACILIALGRLIRRNQ